MPGILWGLIPGFLTCLGMILIYKLLEGQSLLEGGPKAVVRILLQGGLILFAANTSDYFCAFPSMKGADYRNNVALFFLSWTVTGPGLYLGLYKFFS